MKKLTLCGIDEAGRGPLAGSLVMAGVVLKNPIEGLMDSKKLTEKKREALYPLVIENSEYHIVSFSAQEVDELGISKCLQSIQKHLPNVAYLFDGNSTFGVEVIKGAHNIELKKERLTVQKAETKKKVTYFDDYNAEVFDKLRDLRTKIAQANNIPPYIVFSDKTLKDLSVKQPQSKQEMLDVHGIGEVKFEKYGEEFLEVLKSEGLQY